MKYLAGLLMAFAAVLAAISVSAADGTKLLQRLKQARPDIPFTGVVSTPVDNVYQIEIENGGVLYGTADGQFLFTGDLYQIGETALINLTENQREGTRKSLMDSLDTKDLLIFASNGQTKASITVFTDVDCGYCRKLHNEVPALNANGIEVRYVAYPRAGVGSKSYDKIVSAWCADNPQQALTQLKAGQAIPPKTCVNPVASQYDLGQKVGVSGTPSIVLESGRLLPGYMPAADLIAALGLE